VTTQPEPAPSRTEPRQRALILGAAALGLVLLVVYALVGAPFGGGTGAPAPVVLAPSTGAGRPGPTTGRAGRGATTTTEPGMPTTTTTVPAPTPVALTAKDPFKPLVGTGVTATTSSGGGSGVTTTTSATSPGGGASTGRKLTLVSVFRSGGVRYVKVDLDGKRYQAAEGGTIAGAYRVVDVGQSCAEFRSSGGAFTLCEGEAVLK
jgi:hypothetical protein